MFFSLGQISADKNLLVKAFLFDTTACLGELNYLSQILVIYYSQLAFFHIMKVNSYQGLSFRIDQISLI